jgi:hypothetical protein
MKQNKLVIGVLVVIVVLFVLGLSSGLFRDKGPNDNTLTMSKARSYKQRWDESLKGFTSRFRHKLDGGRLLVPEECKPPEKCEIDKKTYKLTKNKPIYTIPITKKKKASVQKAVLSVKTGNVKVQVSYPDKEPCAPPGGTSTARGTRASFKKFKQPKATLNMSRIKPGNLQGGGGRSPKPLTLDVIYTPAGAHEQTNLCEVAGDIDLTVLEQGGLLKLVCTGCDNKRSLTVALE